MQLKLKWRKARSAARKKVRTRKSNSFSRTSAKAAWRIRAHVLFGVRMLGVTSRFVLDVTPSILTPNKTCALIRQAAFADVRENEFDFLVRTFFLAALLAFLHFNLSCINSGH